MSVFQRIFNNQIHYISNVDRLGWSLDEEYLTPPDGYISNGEFVIHRGCYSIGDWSIISAMPRILKEHYPKCKVYVTSENFAEKMYGPIEFNKQNVWGHWKNPYLNVRHVFDNNPYVDGYIDSYEGEIYHDHFRIRDPQNEADPLILQMLRWHGIFLTLEDDFAPELYFSDEEKQQFEEFKQNIFGKSEYGSFSYRVNFPERDYKSHRLEWVQRKLDEYNDLPFMYYFDDSVFNFNLNKVLTANGLDVRLILYLICNSKVVTGLQSGVYDACGRYTDIKVLAAASSIAGMNEHYLPSIKYTFLGEK